MTTKAEWFDGRGEHRVSRVYATFYKDGVLYVVVDRRIGNYDTDTPFQVLEVGGDSHKATVFEG